MRVSVPDELDARFDVADDFEHGIVVAAAHDRGPVPHERRSDRFGVSEAGHHVWSRIGMPALAIWDRVCIGFSSFMQKYVPADTPSACP